jgi:perosamine synthetase
MEPMDVVYCALFFCLAACSSRGLRTGLVEWIPIVFHCAAARPIRPDVGYDPLFCAGLVIFCTAVRPLWHLDAAGPAIFIFGVSSRLRSRWGVGNMSTFPQTGAGATCVRTVAGSGVLPCVAHEDGKGGQLMEDYEARFASIFGADYHAFSFWKGRVALYAILQSMALREHDEVILPGYTCVVVANAIRYAGAKPVYADITSGGFNLDPASVRERITSNTRALIVQHTYGIPADVPSLRTIAEEHGLELIEDCAHVLPGSNYHGQFLGSFGKAAFFSSQWSKPYTTGLGGMVIARDRELAERLERIQAKLQKPPLLQHAQLQFQYALYRQFFRPKFYWHSQKALHALSKLGLLVGSSSSAELTGKRPSDFCWRMGTFQQRVGLAQMDKLEVNLSHRRALSRYYSETLRRHGWRFDDHLNCIETILLRFPLEVENKTRVLKESSRAGIELGSWFETPLHPLLLADHHLVDYQLGSCPVAESTANKVVNLPLHERVTRSDAEKIAQFVLSHTSLASARSA